MRHQHLSSSFLPPMPQQLFLGLDCSTQGVKVVVINETLAVTHEYAVNYDTDLPQFETKGGVHRGSDGLTITTPPQAWVAAFDLLLERMKADNFAFAEVVALSGSGQQHGSVYWKIGAETLLKSLQSNEPLLPQLQTAFSVNESPIWMDSSTTKQCRELEEKLGGAQRIAELTGSRAYERFTRNQIAKIFEEQPAAYHNTERIGLVSSFVASVFLGAYAPIDRSDATGMNLLDLHSKQWIPDILALTAPDLAAKLAPVCPAHTALGPIAPHFAARYGFRSQCLVVAFAGDNPNSVAGMRLNSGDISISLGTSDTVFGVLSSPTPSATEGHIFCNPVDPEGYMALVCYKNGSLTREDVRDRVAQGNWQRFNELLTQSPPGNGGCLGYFFKEAEITPQGALGTYRFSANDEPTTFTPTQEVRAVVEGQFLSMRHHAANIGMRSFNSVLATGGASANSNIVSVIANVFGVPVYTAQTANSASLGAAYRALHGWECYSQKSFVPFAQVVQKGSSFVKIAEPDLAAHKVYTDLLPRYAQLEARILAKHK